MPNNTLKPDRSAGFTPLGGSETSGNPKCPVCGWTAAITCRGGVFVKHGHGKGKPQCVGTGMKPTNPKCTQGKGFCQLHQGHCEKHYYLCGDGRCTCEPCDPTVGTGDSSEDLVTQLKDEADLCLNEHASDVAELLNKAATEICRLRQAITQTLDENAHLADGENCTLIVLKRAMSQNDQPSERARKT